MNANAKIPQLRQDGSSLDWPGAEYTAEIKISGTAALASNALVGAPEIDNLVSRGHANWVLELRCPKTLFVKVAQSDTTEVRCDWRPGDVDGEIFFTPGLVAIHDCAIAASELNAVWGPGEVVIPPGRWIAKGNVVRTESLASSLLRFHRRPQLQDGQMEVTPDTTGGDLRFNVWLSPNYFNQMIQSNRDVQVAALIGAFGRIPLLDTYGESDFAILGHIKSALTEAGVPIWGDENAEFDPAMAATAIEPFYVPPPSGEIQ